MTLVHRITLIKVMACGACLGTFAECSLTVTNERPAYKDLDSEEKSAVDVILLELERLDAQIKDRTIYNIDEIINRERIHVSFEGIIFAGNFGDNVIHVAVWENLSSEQHRLIQEWFAADASLAKSIYETLIYHFMAVEQGVKQFMFKVLGPAWVYSNRTLFSFERDSIRTALAHFNAEGRKEEMWNFLTSSCSSVLNQYAKEYSNKYSKQYLQQHFSEIYDPYRPTGYMYFICRWVEEGVNEAEDLTNEFNWLRDLPLP